MPTTLLFIDQDPLVLFDLAHDLEQLGYCVLITESAHEAEMVLMIEERPDLIILDADLPGCRTVELAKRIVTLYGIPFILLAPCPDETLIELVATTREALGYLVKPIAAPQLIPAIKIAIARAQDYNDLSTTKTQLQTALAAERDTSIAIGITMVQFHLDRHCAFKKLRKIARAQRRKLSDLALDVITLCEKQI